MAGNETIDGSGHGNDLTLNAATRRALGNSFATSGVDYDRVRPGYPYKAIQAVMEFAELRPSDRVFEIGCGSGIGTGALVGAGLEVDALDPSKSLLDVAAQKLEPWSALVRTRTGNNPVHFRHGKLEDTTLDKQYPAVLSFQAIHWVEPTARWSKPAAALKPGGVMAIMSNFPDEALISEDGPDFPDPDLEGHDQVRETRVRGLYKWLCPQFPNADWGNLDRMTEEMEGSGLFDEPKKATVLHEQTYTGEDYLHLQESFSWVKALDEERRAQFLGEVGLLIGDSPEVIMPWRTEVVMARKKA